MINKAQFATVLPAKDVSRAARFYKEKIGLRELDMPAPEDGAFFEAGECSTLYIYHRPDGNKAEHTQATWLVDDVDETVNDLRKKGIEFERYNLPGLKTDERGIAEMNGSKSAWFKDPEGNILAVTSIKD